MTMMIIIIIVIITYIAVLIRSFFSCFCFSSLLKSSTNCFPAHLANNGNSDDMSVATTMMMTMTMLLTMTMAMAKTMTMMMTMAMTMKMMKMTKTMTMTMFILLIQLTDQIGCEAIFVHPSISPGKGENDSRYSWSTIFV